jgi:hypothetical protein
MALVLSEAKSTLRPAQMLGCALATGRSRHPEPGRILAV